MRAALAAILLTIATQAGADTIKELFEKRDVSRLEFTLFKIEQSLLPELQSWLTTSSEDKRASIKVFTSHSNDRISIGASIEGYFSSEKPLFMGLKKGSLIWLEWKYSLTLPILVILLMKMCSEATCFILIWVKNLTLEIFKRGHEAI